MEAAHLVVTADGILRIEDLNFRCALGAGGVRVDKREGDKATPAGYWPLRAVFYRPDRLSAPRTGLPVNPALEQDGWCDAPEDRNYNRRVALPYPASAEALWRADHLYDLIGVLGYNDDPPIPGRGSAIFLHVAQPDYTPTQGCVALALPDLLTTLARCGPGSFIDIRAS